MSGREGRGVLVLTRADSLAKEHFWDQVHRVTHIVAQIYKKKKYTYESNYKAPKLKRTLNYDSATSQVEELALHDEIITSKTQFQTISKTISNHFPIPSVRKLWSLYMTLSADLPTIAQACRGFMVYNADGGGTGSGARINLSANDLRVDPKQSIYSSVNPKQHLRSETLAQSPPFHLCNLE